MIDFEQLTRNMKGDVMTDSLHQMIYATDASAYREMPLAVVYPRDASDVKECIKFEMCIRDSYNTHRTRIGIGVFSCLRGRWRADDYTSYFVEREYRSTTPETFIPVVG